MYCWHYFIRSMVDEYRRERRVALPTECAYSALAEIYKRLDEDLYVSSLNCEGEIDV